MLEHLDPDIIPGVLVIKARIDDALKDAGATGHNSLMVPVADMGAMPGMLDAVADLLKVDGYRAFEKDGTFYVEPFPPS